MDEVNKFIQDMLDDPRNQECLCQDCEIKKTQKELKRLGIDLNN